MDSGWSVAQAVAAKSDRGGVVVGFDGFLVEIWEILDFVRFCLKF